MQLKGTTSEKNSILNALQRLTNHYLYYDANGFVWVKINCFYQTKNWYHNGSALIYRIITSNKTCTIQVNKDKRDYTKYIDPITGNEDITNAINGNGSNAAVYYNPTWNPATPTVNPSNKLVVSTNTDPYIALAHELIHADRAMRGVTIDSTDINNWEEWTYKLGIPKLFLGFLWITDYETYTIKENVKKEELATIGLKYANDITENMIRKEHSLQPRGAYG